MALCGKFLKIIAIIISIIGVRNICADALVYSSERSKIASKKKEPPEKCTFGRQQCNEFLPMNSFWIDGEALYLGVSEDGFGCEFGDVAITTTEVDGVTTATIVEKDKNIDFKWDYGFRIGAGYDFFCSGWGLEVDWTWFHDKDHSRDGANRASWNLQFDTIDAIFGRNFWVGSCFDLKPFSGLRYAWIRQNLTTSLQTPFSTSIGTSLLTTNRDDHQKFWGLGPELGLQADWYLASGFRIYAAIDAAILYGHFNTRNNDINSSATASNICHGEASSGTCQGVYDVDLGVRWENKFMTVHTGLEHHCYLNFNQIGCRGNLNIYGANLGVGFRF